MKSNILTKVYNYLTFTDIPIGQKLLLFAGGGIAWFVVIACIGLGAINRVDSSASEMTGRIVPHMQASQKLIIKIRGANVSVHNIAIHDSTTTVNENFKRSQDLLLHVSEALNALLKGGTIRDYSDLTGELIQEIDVVPVPRALGDRYVRPVIQKSRQLSEVLKELKKAKTGSVENGTSQHFMSMLQEYDSLTVQAVTLLSKLTAEFSVLQEQYTANIHRVLSRAMTIFILVGILAISLVTLFSYFLKASMIKPVKAITDQIRGLSEGEVDLTKQITVGSKDEIAELSSNFNRLMDTIHSMSAFKKVIEEDDNLADVYIRLAKVFHEELGLDDFLIYEATDMKRTMDLVTTPYSQEDICCNKEILIDNNLCRAKKTGHTVSSIAYPEICKQYLLSPEKYHVCIPIIVGGRVGGVVQFQFDKALPRENEEALPILNRGCIERQVLKAEQYIKESSAVIEAKKLTSALRESAVRDQMTGLYNRRFLEEYVETLTAGVQRKGGQIGLLMCDLDFFKEVNDKHGHDAGDAVLKETSHVIEKSARSSDLVIRFGGEEFLVIVNDAKKGDANAAAERIRKKVAATKAKTSGGIIQKTISIGYSEYPNDTQNFWEAIKYADIALYKAKESGRNRVMKFEKEMWTAEAY